MAIITRLIDHFGGNSSSSSAHYKAIGHPALCHIWPPFLANWRKPAPSRINQIKPPVPGHLSSFEIWFGQLLDHATASLMTCGGISFGSLGGSCELTRSGMMRIQGPCLYGRGFFFFFRLWEWKARLRLIDKMFLSLLWSVSSQASFPIFLVTPHQAAWKEHDSHDFSAMLEDIICTGEKKKKKKCRAKVKVWGVFVEAFGAPSNTQRRCLDT